MRARETLARRRATVSQSRTLGALLLLALAARAQDLSAEVERLVEKHRLGAAAAGVCAMRGDEVLVKRRGDETFPLASVTKLYTAAAALEELGPDFALRTTVWVIPAGCARDAKKHVALVVVGRGDPGISGRDHDGKPAAVFEGWADRLKAAGVDHVCRIDLDDTRFGGPLVHESWPKDQLSQWYCAPAGALALNDNCVDVTVAPGDPPRVTLSPETAYVTIDSKLAATPEKGEHRFSIDRKPGTNTLVVRGKVWTKASPWTESITIHDSALFFGTVLRETLARRGLDAAPAPLRRLDAPWDPDRAPGWLVSHETPLPAALSVMLKRSQNFYAENLLRALSADPDALAGGLAAVRRSLSLADADLQQLDGSGLARGNRAAPASTVKFLLAADARPWAAAFREALAVPGEPGTIQKRFAGLESRLRAKTGTIAGVSNLAGYVESPKGRVAFAIFISQLKEGVAPAQAFQEDLVRLLAK